MIYIYNIIYITVFLYPAASFWPSFTSCRSASKRRGKLSTLWR